MRYLSFFFCFFFVFCQNESPQNQLLVIFPQTPLREAPGAKSKVLWMLDSGERLTGPDETSRFESAVYFNDRRFQSPWVRVKTRDDRTGWVFCPAVRPAGATPGDWLLQQRLRCYFGEALTVRRNRYAGIEAAGDKAALAARYREATALRDTFVYLLSRRAEPDEAGFQPDFSWLGEALPHFVFQTTGGSGQPYLFADFRYWAQEARRLGGTESIAYFNACLTAFAADSIESFFPGWKFQISDREAASQLGLRRHLAMFQAIQTALDAGPLFRPELMRFKESLLEDILDKKTTFWQPKGLIIKELNEILAGNFSCLDARDRASLEARVAMFENPEANGIKVNLRSGE